MFRSEEDIISVFSDCERHIAAIYDVGLLQHLDGKSWSNLSNASFLASTTLPNPPSTKTLTGWKLFIETFGSPVLPPPSL